ncbi:cation diffusion facilitator family transporter [Candidatus Saccharibacteria bacterium]|nr:cation diffusion facilitator family transporter [Candidatus Saccharibacteria bacterium]MBR6122126.1 cation diffusion facilitator family transporter [Candidatus Saccharibacteria bacterium]MBR6125983.1 cation diffusion facilitator family transporter [Candidatus Saccharibacteria bacterium]
MEKSRSQVIIKSGYLFIATNFLLAALNLVVGLLAHSLAITSDAAHSLIDAISGFLVVASEKILGRKKYADRRDKIERITTIAIALIILAAGIHIVIEAIEKLRDPETVEYSLATLIILIVSIGLKLALALYLKKQGRTHKSKVLLASGAETMNDMLISVAVLLSIVVYFIWGINIEAYISLAISLVIFKIGLEFIFPHLSRHHHHPLEQNPDHDHCGKSH